MDNFYIDIELEIDDEKEATSEIEFELDEVIQGGGALPYYKGLYTVIPKVKEQKLPTKDKSMAKDLTVTEIPYSEVSNPQGGNTVIIGGEL